MARGEDQECHVAQIMYWSMANTKSLLKHGDAGNQFVPTLVCAQPDYEHPIARTEPNGNTTQGCASVVCWEESILLRRGERVTVHAKEERGEINRVGLGPKLHEKKSKRISFMNSNNYYHSQLQMTTVFP
ncbi:hypothetical protein CDAR_239261 [Caerostris darwini]|uniref:Uncharacterized protein n=1 Tax=Caerostris darwini TaxID=1538125 RepID=A0AAV4SMX3_9ARAC|nr:hypothetical protein CDAR_239261 [Caerostris darwini]